MEIYKLWIFAVVGLTGAHPPGHLKPLGSHVQPIVSIPSIDKFPHPKDFYDNYVKPGRPVLMKNVLKNGDIPAYFKWTDEYMIEHFGNETIELELGKKEDRKHGGMTKAKLGEFLLRYKKMDAYMVQDLPKSMYKDFRFPYTLKCGGFQKMIQMLVTWFSSGSTKSHLHNDHMDNINCLLDGKKDLVMIDKVHSNEIEADGYNSEGSFSDVDVESVNMYKFPKFQELPWYQVNLTKGDCFYIPQRWYHHVYSHPGRNFAVNIWFYHLWWFNDKDCEANNQDYPPTFPINDFPKSAKIEEYRQEILSNFQDEEFVSKEGFKKVLKKNGFDGNVDLTFDNIDLNKDKLLSWDELYSFGDEVFETDFGRFLIQMKGEEEGTYEELDEETEDLDEFIRTAHYDRELENGQLDDVIETKHIKITEGNIVEDPEKVIDDIESNDITRDEL